MSLRREVYLQAAAALTHTNSLVARAANVDYNQNKISDEFAADLATISKVHVVASDDTIDAVMTYMNELGPAFMEMTRRRMPLAIRSTILLPDAILAVRNEMRMPLDRIRYERNWELQREKMREAWVPVRSDIEQLIAKMEADARSQTAPPPST
jgi:hypothetical protein